VDIRHQLKQALREIYARLVFHSGAHRLLDRWMPRRLLVLAGHCVATPGNAELGPDMRIETAELERMLTWFARRYEVLPLARALERLEQPGRRSLVALTMDDGYKDNRSALLPLLQRLQLSATLYLESAPLEERRLNWTHKFSWTVGRIGPARFAELYGDRAGKKLAAGPSAYQLKRALKYEVPVEERTRIVGELFREQGGDERALCEQLYLDWDEVRELDRAGIEIGAHTHSHDILSRLEPAQAARDIERSKEVLERGLGHPVQSFAYPFGRRWDYTAATQEAARAAGFASATTTVGGTNGAPLERFGMRRVMISERTRLHRLATEACGGFDLLRRFGIEFGDS